MAPLSICSEGTLLLGTHHRYKHPNQGCNISTDDKNAILLKKILFNYFLIGRERSVYKNTVTLKVR